MNLPGDDPIGWRVHMLMPRDKIDGYQSEPYQVDFKTKKEADHYKRQKQEQGWVANTTPVFLTPQVRGKARKTLQGRTAPPDFNHDWRLHSTPLKDGG